MGKDGGLCPPSFAIIGNNMIRTRDFFLFIQAVAFLLLAISVTALSWPHSNSVSAYSNVISKVEKETDYKATIASNLNDKEERLNNLRQKIREQSNVATVDSVLDGSAPVSTSSTLAFATTTSALPTKKEIKVKECGNYHVSETASLNGQLIYVEHGNQRVFSSVTTKSVAVGTSSELQSVEKVVLNLPIRTEPVPFSSCLSSDIVAVTVSGAPIHNKDYANYAGSGEGSLIGYTLDGFSLFGQSSTVETDKCGGVSIDGVYRYYLSPERKAVLNCFAGIPANL